MKFNGVFFVRRVLKDTRGQTLPFVVLGLTFFLGLAGVATDLGHGYAARRQLQESTNSAALAGAQGLPNTTLATTYVTEYSVLPTEKNASQNLINATVTPTFTCLSTLTSAWGLGCATSTGSTAGNFNSLKVTQTAQVPLWFGKMFGVPYFNIWATATAAMAGGNNTPWNVAIILDTTASMASADSGLQCSGTQISCALQGVQTLLGLMAPCPLNTTCVAQTGSYPQTLMVKNPVDTVSLFVFPAVTTATESKDYVCPTSNPSTIPYTFQNVTPGASQNLNLPSTATYEIVPFSGNYRVSDAATTLNTSSSSYIVLAAGGKSGCNGMGAPGGQGTYYAQVIYAAQAALVAQAAANPGTQNAMIILTDGDATASGSQITATTGTLNGTGSGSNKNSFAYPSALGECGQAVLAAHAATAAGTTVYTIGYGSETTGCTTDKTYSAYPGITPCTAIMDMASAPGDFYSDDGHGCVSPNEANFTNLKQIFTAISKNLTTTRLVPNGTT